MPNEIKFKIHAPLQNYQYSNPIFGFMLPLGFFVPPSYEVPNFAFKENNGTYNDARIKPAPAHTAKPVPVRRLMHCNRVD